MPYTFLGTPAVIYTTCLWASPVTFGEGFLVLKSSCFIFPNIECQAKLTHMKATGQKPRNKTKMGLFGAKAAAAAPVAAGLGLNLPPDYGFVLIAAALLVLENFILGAMVMGVRKKVFSSPEWDKNSKVKWPPLLCLVTFPSQNKPFQSPLNRTSRKSIRRPSLTRHWLLGMRRDSTPLLFVCFVFVLFCLCSNPIPCPLYLIPHSYPDMGSGRFSEKLTYSQWYQFNNAQRGHQNFLESAWGVQSLLLGGGLFEPRVYAALAAVYIVSRFLYAIGYTSAKGPKGREAGAIGGLLAVLGMIVYTIYLGITLVKGRK